MRNILIVEDEPHVVRVMQLALENNGYEVGVANNGEQALAILEKGKPDILITDINMPRMSGETLCKKIEENMPKRNFPILVLTSKTEIEHRDWTNKMENTFFLEKPVSIRKLLKMLEEHKKSDSPISYEKPIQTN